jgi:predicted Zn-dependent peptidase
VRDKKIAAQTGAIPGFPGSKYPNMMVFFAVPSPGHSNEEVQAALREEIEKLKAAPISDDDLKMVKTRAKAGLIRRLGSNNGIAGQLARYETLHGDWRELFRSVERIGKVTKDDISGSESTFIPHQPTVAMIVNEKAADSTN